MPKEDEATKIFPEELIKPLMKWFVLFIDPDVEEEEEEAEIPEEFLE